MDLIFNLYFRFIIFGCYATLGCILIGCCGAIGGWNRRNPNSRYWKSSTTL